MKKYSTEYWLRHYEFAMGHKERVDIDSSNANWTKNNLTRILQDEYPFGMSGINIANALIQYLEKYEPNEMQRVSKLMLRYIESIQTPEKPLRKVHEYYFSVIAGL
jgi:hypothetical protein